MFLHLYVNSKKQKNRYLSQGENSGKQHKKAYIYFVRLFAILSLYSEEGQYDQIKVGLLAHAFLFTLRTFPSTMEHFFFFVSGIFLFHQQFTVAETASAFNRIPY